MRKGIEIEVAAGDRARLEAIVADRNRRQKHAERARVVLLTADGMGTLAMMRTVGCAKATVWRWQERFMAEGVAGLLRDKSRPPGKAPLAAAVVLSRFPRSSRSANLRWSSWPRPWRCRSANPNLPQTDDGSFVCGASPNSVAVAQRAGLSALLHFQWMELLAQ